MTQTIQDILNQAKKELALVTDQPALEAEVLLAHTMKVSRSHLQAWPLKEVSDSVVSHFYQYLHRRLRKEPIAYLIEQKEFWSLLLSVNEATLIPRPETECLVEAALQLGISQRFEKIADLGTGSGAIALALAKEWPHADIHATDISPEALNIAKKNAQDLGMKNIQFYEGHWCQALRTTNFEMLISNPPYIGEREWGYYQEGLAYEPRDALVSGPEGLLAIREIIQEARLYLKTGGYLLLEHGYQQGSAVRDDLLTAGYQSVLSLPDLTGLERVSLGQWVG